MKAFRDFFRNILNESSSWRFTLGIWLGLSFSLAVILCTLGLMDGFQVALEQGLIKSEGDITVRSSDGFIDPYEVLAQEFKELKFDDWSGLIQSQAFLVHEKEAKGVVLKGIKPESFEKVTGLNISLKPGELAIGGELQKSLNLEVGQDLTLVLAGGNREFNSLPTLVRKKVGQVIRHGVYEKDLRFVYLPQEELAKHLGVSSLVNIVSLKVSPDGDREKIELAIGDLENAIGVESFIFRPYWYQYSPILEAVEIEKITIGLILQIIVIVSLFNVLSFILFLSESKAQEIFLFRALGMSNTHLAQTWLVFTLILWVLSCLMGVVLSEIFDYLLGTLSVFNLPGEIYHMARMSLKIGLEDYGVVFFGALIQLFIINAILYYRIHRHPILHGLRREFS